MLMHLLRAQPRRSVGRATAHIALFALPFVFGACGRVGKAAMRGAERGVARAVDKELAAVLRRDAARDARLVAKPLKAPRTVYRFTTEDQAAREAEAGLAPGSHLTARGGQGRPLSATSAQARYGLPARPEVRETVTLPGGLPMRSAKTVGGARGVGEMTAPSRIPADAIKRIVVIR